MMKKLLLVICSFVVGSSLLLAQQNQRVNPDLSNASYGPHERNVIDLWKAQSDKTTPLVIYIHGGGFRGGSKETINPQLLRLCLENGISVAAINYRLSQHAPFPAQFLDSARALQFIRSKAKEWNIDPKRVACTGGSAGAGISLWLAFHEDLADRKSDDPVARQSTRITCAGVFGAQVSYDPRWIKEHVGGRAHEHPALALLYGLKPEELDSPRAHKMYEAASPINYLTKDDPSVWMFYNEGKGPLPADAPPGQGIHHPNFGNALKEKMDKFGIECIVRHVDDGINAHREMVDFFIRQLKR